MSKKFHTITLGCKVNQYESHSIREAWERAGWFFVEKPTTADIILVNTCAVTARGVADGRSTIRRLNRENPAASIIVTGCAAEVFTEEFAGLPGVSEVAGRIAKEKLLEIPYAQANGEEISIEGNTYPKFSINNYDRSRAVLKVQDGCSHRCTYCIVPLARGRAVSRPTEEVIAEAKRLLDAGFREIILSGVNLRQFRDQEKDFWDLVSALELALGGEWAGKMRFRISSLEPGQCGDKALAVLSQSKLIAPHLHLSLQSGSPAVLKRMGRGHYNPSTIGSFLESLRQVWPIFALGADILTGFPGETDAEFEETLALCRELPFSYAHVFPFSARPGTAAAKMTGQLPQQIKKERAAALRQVLEGKRKEFLGRISELPCLGVVFEGLKTAGTEAQGGTEGSKQRGSAQVSGILGICEYYVDCVLEDAAQRELPGIVETVPYGHDSSRIMVRAK